MATINDVARAAGVSPSTVSYVISGKRTVSPATRRRVQQCIRLLGYKPRGRSLVSRTNLLALLVPLCATPDSAAVTRLAAAAASSARSHGSDLLLLTRSGSPGELRSAISGSLSDGLIVLDVTVADARVPMLTVLDRPTVLIGVPDDSDTLTCLDLDYVGAAGLALGYLADLGHRSVGLVAPSAGSFERGASHAVLFRRGFSETAARRGVRAVDVPCGSGSASGEVESCLDALFTKLPDLTGLVVHNDAVLPAVLEALTRRGLAVPRDVSVITVGQDGVSGSVGLTTVAVPAGKLGKLAVEMVVRQLEDEVEPEVRLLAPRLVVRGSTAAVLS